MIEALKAPCGEPDRQASKPGVCPASLLSDAPTIRLRGHEQAAETILRQDIQEPFAAKRLALVRLPLDAGGFRPGRSESQWGRHTQTLVKSRSTETLSLDGLEKPVAQFCQRALADARYRGLPVEDRYAYLTVDDRWVFKGQAQLADGWHLAGMQGREVPVSLSGCYQYVWSDAVPVTMALQGFDLTGLERLTVPFPEFLASQVNPSCCQRLPARRMMLMSGYLVQRAMPENVSGYRKFLRLRFTQDPMT